MSSREVSMQVRGVDDQTKVRLQEISLGESELAVLASAILQLNERSFDSMKSIAEAVKKVGTATR